MRCSSCSFENPGGNKFCGNCGTALTTRCADCGFENAPGIKFCGECGNGLAGVSEPSPNPRSYTPKHFAERILPEHAAMEARGAAEGERKTITALFADIKGSVELVQQLDPEEARAIVDPALELMMDAVRHYEGRVAQTLGDGIFALFGAPVAHEDHPRRAIHAALRMQEQIKAYAEKLRLDKRIDLEIRVGIDTGEAVVRSIRKDAAHTDYVPVGHSANMASRLQGLASPGTVLVSEATRRLIEGYFDVRPRGPVEVKGIVEPVTVFEIAGPSALRTRIEVSARRGLTPFVGRRDEMETLRKALERALEGKGQVVGIVGDAGVGKSRLLYEFRSFVPEGCLILESAAEVHRRASPYGTLVELLKRYFSLEPEDDEETRRSKITRATSTLDPALAADLPYLFFVLSILEPASTLHQMDPQLRRERTFEAIRRVLLHGTVKRPVVLVVEDLHWIDGETHTFLVSLGESLARARLLLLANYRPEYEQPWGHRAHFAEVRLDPLETASAEEMLARILGSAPELCALKDMILERSEGTPFFIEEIVQGLFEEGVLVRDGGVALAKRPHDFKIPTTVQAVLTARIDRLTDDEKELLQTASVLGKDFPLALLQTAAGRPEAELRVLLTRLQAADLLYEEPGPLETRCTFKHALTREVAYGSLLRERRASLHERVARAIEDSCSDRVSEVYGELAHHYSCSANSEKAIAYLISAGKQAAQNFAHAEATSYLERALGKIEGLKLGRERDECELAVQMALAAVCMTGKGEGAPETETAFSRARELSRHLGDARQLFSSSWGVWFSQVNHAELQSSRALAEELIALAESLGDEARLAQARVALAIPLFFLGDFSGVIRHTEKVVEAYDSGRDRPHLFLDSLDAAADAFGYAIWAHWIAGFSYSALAHWACGSPEQALPLIRRALEVGKGASRPHVSAIAHTFAASLHMFRREPREAFDHAETAVAIAREWRFPQWVGFGNIFAGWALALLGTPEAATARILEGIEQATGTGSTIGGATFGLSLIEAYRSDGKLAEALVSVDALLGLAAGTGERAFESELHRLKAELLLASPANHKKEAETSLERAIGIARSQGARSLELRATTSLARMLTEDGRKDEARACLRQIYGWFTEGFDTADLKDAKDLLDELSD